MLDNSSSYLFNYSTQLFNTNVGVHKNCFIPSIVQYIYSLKKQSGNNNISTIGRIGKVIALNLTFINYINIITSYNYKLKKCIFRDAD